MGLCWLGLPGPPWPALPGNGFCSLLVKGSSPRLRGPAPQGSPLIPQSNVAMESLCSLPLSFLCLGKDTEGLSAQSCLNGWKGWCTQKTSSPKRPVWRQSLLGKDKGHRGLDEPLSPCGPNGSWLRRGKQGQRARGICLRSPSQRVGRTEAWGWVSGLLSVSELEELRSGEWAFSAQANRAVRMRLPRHCGLLPGPPCCLVWGYMCLPTR